MDEVDVPIHSARKMRIICIGAGPSGLCFAYKLQRSFENFELVLYDKNSQVAGTWFENTYPGCRCDLPSVNYVYTFEPKLDYATVYAPASEIRKYFEDFSKKHELGVYCKLQHKVLGAQWDDENTRWNLRIQNLASGITLQDSCDILISATGYLNNWQWPTINGLEKFEGPLLHSAAWRDEVSLVGKRVGLIGNGYLASFSPLIMIAKADKVIGHPNTTLNSTGRGYTDNFYSQSDLGVTTVWTSTTCVSRDGA